MKVIKGRWTFWALLGGVLAAGFLEAADQKKTDKPKDAAKTHTVKAGPFADRMSVEGVLEAAKRWPLRVRLKAASSAAPLEVIEAIRHGETVRKGQVLVRFKTEAIDRAIEAAERSEKSAATVLTLQQREMKLAERAEDLGLDAAQRSYDRAALAFDRFVKIHKPLMVESAQMSLKSSQQRLESQLEELKQLRQMYKEDDLTEETEEIILKRQQHAVEYARFGLKRAKASHEESIQVKIPQAQQDLEHALALAHLALDRAKATLPLKTTQAAEALAKAEAAHRSAERKLKLLREDRKQFELKSPADGRVLYGRYSRGKWTHDTETARGMKPGGRLAANTVLMNVVAPRPMRIRVALDARQRQKLKIGQIGSFEPKALPGQRWSVKLTEVAAVPLGGSFTAHLEPDWPEPPQNLHPGMAGTVRFTVYETEQALTVPLAGIQYGADQKPFVRVKKKGQEAEKRPVELGPVSGDSVVIRKGLSEGDVIELNRS
ncbi:MAG: hypothetical protein R3236_02995 [Phycisphaeraceae bacterium]|nr:hypothetical protein [Phycisphaeraceae bacterium]